MGLKEAGVPANHSTFLSFVPLLGAFVMDTPENRKAVKTARAESGANQTDGYQGYKGDTPSAKALAYLDKEGVKRFKSISGLLRGVSFREKPVEGGGVIRTVFVTLRDGDDAYTARLDAGNSGTHMLLHKLAQVGLNDDVEISVFGHYGPNKNAPDGPSYTDYGASVKIAGNEVKIPEGAWDAVKVVTSEMEAQLSAVQGMTGDAIKSAVRAAKINFYVKMATAISDRISGARDAEKPHDEPGAPARGPQEGGKVGDGFNDDDDIPF